MTVPIIAAKKGSDTAARALTGDIYTRRWTSVKGTGRKKREIDHEVHVNPMTLAIGAVAAGVGAVGLGLGLWLTQRKLTADDGKEMVRIVDWHDPVRTTYTVTSTTTVPTYHPPVYETIQIPVPGSHGDIYIDKEILVTEGYTTYEEVETSELKEKFTDGWAVARTQKGGVPIKYVRYGFNEQPDAYFALSAGERARGWEYMSTDKTIAMPWGKRIFYRFKNDKKKTYGLGERAGFDMGIDIL